MLVQVTSGTAASSTCMCTPTHQCPGLVVRIDSNILASIESAAAPLVLRSFILRVSVGFRAACIHCTSFFLVVAWPRLHAWSIVDYCITVVIRQLFD